MSLPLVTKVTPQKIKDKTNISSFISAIGSIYINRNSISQDIKSSKKIHLSKTESHFANNQNLQNKL